MRRDLLITILLIIAGIVLAFVLFGAGTMWRSRVSVRPARMISLNNYPEARSVRPLLSHLVNSLAEFEALGVAFVSLRDNLDLSTRSGRLGCHGSNHRADLGPGGV